MTLYFLQLWCVMSCKTSATSFCRTECLLRSSCPLTTSSFVDQNIPKTASFDWISGSTYSRRVDNGSGLSLSTNSVAMSKTSSPRVVSTDEAGTVLATFVPSAAKEQNGSEHTRIDIVVRSSCWYCPLYHQVNFLKHSFPPSFDTVLHVPALHMVVLRPHAILSSCSIRHIGKDSPSARVCARQSRDSSLVARILNVRHEARWASSLTVFHSGQTGASRGSYRRY